MPELTEISARSSYTTVDLNATGTTALLNTDTDTLISGVYLLNGGGTAEVDLEITDGSDTATLEENGAGENVAFGSETVVPESETLQANVQTAEGAAQSNTAVVIFATP